MSSLDGAAVVAAREALHRGELSMTLEASEGSRFRLTDLGKLCTGFHRLMQAITKEAAPDAKVEWCITGLGLMDDKLRVTIGAYSKTRRRRPPKTSDPAP